MSNIFRKKECIVVDANDLDFFIRRKYKVKHSCLPNPEPELVSAKTSLNFSLERG